MTAALVPIDRPSPDFASIVEAFVARDYASAARLAGDFVHQAGPLQGIQLGLISLRRIGADDEAWRLAQAVIDRTCDADPWSAALVGLSVGHRQADDVLDRTTNDVEFCQASFYAGAASMTDGRTDDAAARFDRCLATGAPCLELYLAGVERADLVPAG